MDFLGSINSPAYYLNPGILNPSFITQCPEKVLQFESRACLKIKQLMYSSNAIEKSTKLGQTKGPGIANNPEYVGVGMLVGDVIQVST